MKSGMSTQTVSEYKYVLSIGDKLGDYVDEWIGVVNNTDQSLAARPLGKYTKRRRNTIPRRHLSS